MDDIEKKYDNGISGYFGRVGNFLKSDYARTVDDFKGMYTAGRGVFDAATERMKDTYKKDLSPGYANGPSNDSSFSALARHVIDQQMAATKEYFDAQRIIYAGMKSK